MKKRINEFTAPEIFVLRIWLIAMIISTGSLASRAQEATETGTISPAEGKAVQDTADAWLALIDDLEYIASYQKASELLHDQIDEVAWIQKMKSTHGPLRGLVSRAPQMREFKTALPNMPKGEYIIITYGSKYLQADDVVETVVFAKAEDGVWQAADYTILAQ